MDIAVNRTKKRKRPIDYLSRHGGNVHECSSTAPCRARQVIAYRLPDFNRVARKLQFEIPCPKALRDLCNFVAMPFSRLQILRERENHQFGWTVRFKITY